MRGMSKRQASRNRALANLYHQGNTIYALAKAYAITPQRVWQILKAQGVTLRPRGGYMEG